MYGPAAPADRVKMTWDQNYPLPSTGRNIAGKGTWEGLPVLKTGNQNAGTMILWPAGGGKLYSTKLTVTQDGGQPKGTFVSQAIPAADRPPVGTYTVIAIGVTANGEVDTPPAVIDIVD
ncbi:MAG: hypothetical protein K2X87_20175 [Gemmataceae bacterium]|nr:hypothetical protein [Gemmataceae bacterium]